VRIQPQRVTRAKPGGSAQESVHPGRTHPESIPTVGIHPDSNFESRRLRGPSPEEVAADAALALLDETEEEVEALFAAQHTNKKAECVDIFDAVLDQLNSISPIKTVSWKISSSAKYKPRVASVLDFRADASMAAKRTLSAGDYVWFDNVFMQGLWPVAIVPADKLARIRIAVGSAWKRAGLAHYFNTPPKKVLHQ
jgi:hypothetical protein